VIIKPSPVKTRLLVTYGDEEQLRAVLPAAGRIHPRAAPTLLEGLSLWLGHPLSVVLCADAGGTSSELGLCDGLGFGRAHDALRRRGGGPEAASARARHFP
jgi:hypothetical protein